MNNQPKPRDGVWTANGLSADFRHLYKHPNCAVIHCVETAAGKSYAPESELQWDAAPAKSEKPISDFAREVCTLLGDVSGQYAPLADELAERGWGPKWAAVQIMQNIEGPMSDRWRELGSKLGLHVD